MLHTSGSVCNLYINQLELIIIATTIGRGGREGGNGERRKEGGTEWGGREERREGQSKTLALGS